MGMTVEGRNPTAKTGEDFCINLWGWRPIHHLICRLCSDLFDEDTLKRFLGNGGAGPGDQATCTEMVNRFEVWMEHNANGHTVANDDELAESPHTGTETPYKVSDDALREWIEFLRHCGGFEVW